MNTNSMWLKRAAGLLAMVAYAFVGGATFGGDTDNHVSGGIAPLAAETQTETANGIT